MTLIQESTKNLLDLIKGKYNKVAFEPWGMKEYDDFEERYLKPLTPAEQVEVFQAAYHKMEDNSSLEQNIKQLFYLASVYTVPFYEVYFDILEQETDTKKLRLFFREMHYYIDDCWSDSYKNSLTEHERELLKKYCERYQLPVICINE